MAEVFLPFDAGPGSGVVEAQWTSMARLWLDDGVVDGYNNELLVFADNTGLQVKVSSGAAWVEGGYYENTTTKTITGLAPDATNPRIYRIVLEEDWAANTIAAKAIAGAPAVNPSPPGLTQTLGSLWQHSLAQVLVLPTPSTSISADKVTDERIFPRIDRTTPPGVVADYAGSSAPRGWLLCYGQAVSRKVYARLFAAMGTTFGVGDSSTTFGLPDLRGRVLLGLDNMGGSAAGVVPAAATLGGTGGEATHTLTTAELPGHTHTVAAITVATEGTHVHGPGTLTGTSAANFIGHIHSVGGVTLGAVADHWHSPGTLTGTSGGASAGHTHPHAPGTAASEAAHTHGTGSYAASAASTGAHTHDVTGVSNTGTDIGTRVQTTVFPQFSAAGTAPAAAVSNGGHAHTVSLSGASAAGSGHTHTLSGSTDVQSADHTHVTSMSTGITAAAGSHGHTLGGTTDSTNDAHTHTVTMQAGGSGSGTAHTHVLGGNTDSTGGGGAHANIQPYLALNKIVKY